MTVSSSSHSTRNRVPHRSSGGTVGHHRHPQRDLRRDLDVAQHQVGQRVRPRLRHRQGLVALPVVTGQLLHRRPHRARRRRRQRREPVRQPVLPGTDLHTPTPSATRHVRRDLVRRHPRRDPPGLTRDPGRVHRRQPRRQVSIDPHTRLHVQPRAGVDDLLHVHARHVARDEQLTHPREPLTHRGTQRRLPTRDPLGQPRRQAHPRRGHRVDEPHRVHPLPRPDRTVVSTRRPTPPPRRPPRPQRSPSPAPPPRARTPPPTTARDPARPARPPAARTPRAAPRCGGRGSRCPCLSVPNTRSTGKDLPGSVRPQQNTIRRHTRDEERGDGPSPSTPHRPSADPDAHPVWESATHARRGDHRR